MATPRRTLKRAVALQTGRTITSDELLDWDEDYYFRLRPRITKQLRTTDPIFVCGLCGYAVYAPLAGGTRKRFWKHAKGAPTTCDWWTGDPLTIDQVSARQFAGQQESPLHKRMKEWVGELFELDPLTEAGSVIVDQYLITEEGKRRPDVRAVHAKRRVVVEVQLATTQIPIIAQREAFYVQNGYGLLWVTWGFQPDPGRRLQASISDIYTAHNKNIFSLDEDVIEQSKKEGKFLLRVFWKVGSDWCSKVVALADLTWADSGQIYAVDPLPEWNERFRERWLAALGERRLRWQDRDMFVGELAQRLGEAKEKLEEWDLISLVELGLSVKEGRPVASAQSNLTELLNTFLSAKGRHEYAGVVEILLRGASRSDLLLVGSTRKKLDLSKSVQEGEAAAVAMRAMSELFPEYMIA